MKFIFLLIFINLFILLRFKKISNYLNIYDMPDESRKIHKKPVALIGGFILIFNIFLFFSFFLQSSEVFWNTNSLIIFTLSSFVIFLVGVFDDKYKISANTKLLVFFLLFSTLCFIEKNILITQIQLSFLYNPIFLNKYSLIFTIFCFLLFINAFNMFDGINLQCGLYAIIIIIYLFSKNLNLILLLSLIVPLIFFLYLNYKNICFLGNSGSHLLGFVISYIIVFNYNLNKNFFADEIFLLMAIPGYELLRLAILRVASKKHPFTSDNNHIHHLIIRKTNLFTTNFIVQSLILIPILIMFFFKSVLLSISISLIAYIFLIFLFKK